MQKLKLPILNKSLTRVCAECGNAFGDSYKTNDVTTIVSPDINFLNNQANQTFDVKNAFENPTDGKSKC